jgi:hypothetical protein
MFWKQASPRHPLARDSHNFLTPLNSKQEKGFSQMIDSRLRVSCGLLE